MLRALSSSFPRKRESIRDTGNAAWSLFVILRKLESIQDSSRSRSLITKKLRGQDVTQRLDARLHGHDGLRRAHFVIPAHYTGKGGCIDNILTDETYPNDATSEGVSSAPPSPVNRDGPKKWAMGV